ncbi:MAG TPA: type II toxin-antitoxin system antitoxin, RelB/DinJ family [Ruminococcaceae bacterium]|jgi:DNA-damage-inducible protein J|nr:type II toxin-antitoxin system antitoxin, RelB/DinJ family [Oscillospiraceae bacterium]
MAKVSTNISMDAEVKKEAQALFSDFGLDLTTAINLFLRQSIREQRIPFEITRKVPNAETIEAINEVNAMKKNSTAYQGYSDADK